MASKSTNKIEITYDALPKQLDFLRAVAREVLYSGAFGAGKTRALLLRLVVRAARAGTRELLCRKNNVSLKRSTLHTLLNRDGDLPPVLSDQMIEYHNKSEQVIKVRGGGEIIYCGLDDPAKIGSVQLTGVAVDEAIELTEDDWTMLRGRIRVKVKGVSNQIYAATNPGAPSHFLAQRFGLSGDNRQPSRGCFVVQTCTRDNFFLPPDYVADLAAFTGVARARYFEGQWVSAEGLVYPDMADCIIPHATPPEGVGVGGIDFGFRNPFCALAAVAYHVDDFGPVLYVHHERYQAEVPIRQHARALKSALGSDYLWHADPEDPEAMQELRREGLQAVKAKKHILAGVQSVNGLIAQGRLFISDRCENLRKEAEVYCYNQKNEKEKPADSYNHAMDALRYLVVGAKRHGLVTVEEGAHAAEIVAEA